jgi:hypothetical protein
VGRDKRAEAHLVGAVLTLIRVAAALLQPGRTALLEPEHRRGKNECTRFFAASALRRRDEAARLGALFNRALQPENRIAFANRAVVTALLRGEQRVAVRLGRGVEHRLRARTPQLHLRAEGGQDIIAPSAARARNRGQLGQRNRRRALREKFLNLHRGHLRNFLQV